MRGRRLYRAVAEASLANAKRFLADARVLQRRGSIGHACSLRVLAVEEASKGLIYKLAAEGIVRIVKKRPDNIASFSESDLRDHKIKHAHLARLLAGAIAFAPFGDALTSTRKATFTRGEVESILRRVHTAQLLQALEINRGGQVTRTISRVFGTLGKLNTIKNQGLYVDHSAGRVRVPRSEVRRVASDVRFVASLSVRVAEETIRRQFDPAARRELAELQREVATQVRAVERAKKAQGTGNPPRRPE